MTTPERGDSFEDESTKAVRLELSLTSAQINSALLVLSRSLEDARDRLARALQSDSNAADIEALSGFIRDIEKVQEEITRANG